MTLQPAIVRPQGLEPGDGLWLFVGGQRGERLGPMKAKLSARLERLIVDHIRDAGLPTGRHLGAQKLADLFKVSRAPVTTALAALAARGVVRSERNRGFFVAMAGDELPRPASEPVEDEDHLYFAIAEDWLSGRLRARISENELMRHYGVSRARLRLLLGRIVEEGWIARLPGHSWEFQPILSSATAYEQAYRFRVAIEREALRQPGYTVDPTALAQARAEQQELLDGAMHSLPRDRLFDINSTFHEMIVSWSGNPFFLDAIRRVNRLRRLIEYRATLDRSRLGQQCREHLALLDLLESGDLPAAAGFVEAHVEQAGVVKSPGAAGAVLP